MLDTQLNDFEQYRPLLFSIAYRMLGSVMEAEDMVQETFVRYQKADISIIQSPRNYLCSIVTRLCLDNLKSARSQRETYIGTWLPEPLLTQHQPELENPAGAMSKTDSISMAFLVLLEALNPLERAVFLLREVFDYDYHEIAPMLEKSEATCRQAFSRAKKHISEHRPRFDVSQETHQHMVMRFLQAIQGGELSALQSLLAEDVTIWSDGGGKIAAATRPIHGREAAAKFIAGLVRQSIKVKTTAEIVILNGRESIVVRNAASKLQTVLILESDGTHLTALRFIRNPDKLRHLQ
jgi:RNA polymerase sigma-70 factor (ECF subfamily)